MSVTAMDVMAPAVKRVRAYFAPVARTVQTPTVFDPAQNGAFVLDTPPSPWIDLGWISGFARTCGTKVGAVLAGAPMVVKTQVREEIEASVVLRFESWGKLQLSLAAGTQQMNLLKTMSGAAASWSGGTAVTAAGLLSGSTASVLQMSPSDAAMFAVGGLVAVDVDYAGEIGFLGSGVSGAYVKSALTDVDYVRRVTLNVSRIASIVEGAVTLASPLIAGAPVAGMKVSSVRGFCDREGSTFFQEWSAVFVAEGQQGERVVWHYPRLQAMAGVREEVSSAAGGYQTMRLTGAFRALPVVDSVDGERVVCFRSYVTG